MSGQLRVICTDRGAHGSRDLGALAIDDDGNVSAVTVRKAAAPRLRGAIAKLPEFPGETHTLRGSVYVNAPDVRDDYGDRRRFTFSCATCGRRKVTWNEVTAQRVIEAHIAAGASVVDVSLVR